MASQHFHLGRHAPKISYLLTSNFNPIKYGFVNEYANTQEMQITLKTVHNCNMNLIFPKNRNIISSSFRCAISTTTITIDFHSMLVTHIQRFPRE